MPLGLNLRRPSIQEIRRRRIHLAVPPFFYSSIALAAGIWLAGFGSVSFSAAALAAFALLLTAGARIGKRSFILVNFVLFLCLGLLFGISANASADRHIALMVQEGRLVLEGVVSSVPERVAKGRRVTDSFVLRANNFYRDGQIRETEGAVQVFLHNAGREIQFGDRLRISGMLEEPKGRRNPHSFDYGEYLRTQGMRKIFRGAGRYAVLKQMPAESGFFVTRVGRLRTHLRKRIQALLDPPASELASGLVLGFRKGIPHSIRDDFILSGTAHLLAISGLHLSMLGGIVFMLAAFAGVPRIPRLLVTIVFILIYTAVAGSKPPVLRAGIMGTVVLSGLVLSREKDERSAYFFALGALLVWDPKLLFQVSFQLSFAALAALLFILPRLKESVFRITPLDLETRRSERKRLRKGMDSHWAYFWRRIEKGFRETFLASLAVTLGLFPPLIYYFHIFSLVGFAANLIAVPLGSAAITAVLFVLLADWAAPFVAAPLSAIPALLLDGLVQSVRFFGSLPYGFIPLPVMPVWAVGLYYLLLTGWLFTIKRPAARWIPRMLLASFAALLVFCFFVAPLSGRFPRVTFFDVGRGTSMLIRFSNRSNALINAGRQAPSDQVYWILRPFLMAEGVRKIDTVILTKLDASRAGAFGTLWNYYRPAHVLTPEPFQAGSKRNRSLGKVQKGTNYRVLKSGDLIRFGADREEFLKILGVEKNEILALRIHGGGESVLCVTSSRREAFKTLAALEGLESEILYLPHGEGTLTFDAERLIKAVRPRIIISNQRGETKDFRHALQEAADAEIIWMEDSGAVELIKQGSVWKAKPFLESHPAAGRRTIFTP